MSHSHLKRLWLYLYYSIAKADYRYAVNSKTPISSALLKWMGLHQFRIYMPKGQEKGCYCFSFSNLKWGKRNWWSLFFPRIYLHTMKVRFCPHLPQHHPQWNASAFNRVTPDLHLVYMGSGWNHLHGYLDSSDCIRNIPPQKSIAFIPSRVILKSFPF